MKTVNTAWKIAVLVLYLTGLGYFLLPEPIIPNLPNSVKSTEPGDTVEMPGVWAYYTNLSRQEVIGFYKKVFSHSAFFGLPLITYRLNHPPEYALVTIRDTIRSNFYEELVHPLESSLFVSGWIPKEDKVYLSLDKDAVTYFLVEGKKYNGKMLLYHVTPPFWATALIWTGIIGAGLILAAALRKIIKSPWRVQK